MLEKSIENYLKNEIEKLGGYCLKFAPPGNRFWPDRIILLDQGFVMFCETKTPSTDLNNGQRRCHDKLSSKGHIVTTAHSREECDIVIDACRRWMNHVKRI